MENQAARLARQEAVEDQDRSARNEGAKILLVAKLRIRRLFTGIPSEAASEAIAKAGCAVSEMSGSTAPASESESVTAIAELWLRDRDLAEETASTFAELARDAPRHQVQQNTQSQPQSTRNEMLEAMEMKEDRGRQRYPQLGCRMQLAPFKLQCLYPHVWVVPRQGVTAATAATRWMIEAERICHPAMFKQTWQKERATEILENIASWIVDAYGILQEQDSTKDVFALMQATTFRVGWSLFISLAELVAITRSKSTASFRQAVDSQMSLQKTFSWNDVFEKLKDSFRREGGTNWPRGRGRGRGFHQFERGRGRGSQSDEK